MAFMIFGFLGLLRFGFTTREEEASIAKTDILLQAYDNVSLPRGNSIKDLTNDPIQPTSEDLLRESPSFKEELEETKETQEEEKPKEKKIKTKTSLWSRLCPSKKKYRLEGSE